MKQPEPSMQRIAELQKFIADFSRVERVPQLADTGRLENDVDHSFGLALTCWFLVPKIAPDLSLEKIFQYALAHDTVEIYAGDTFVFASKEELGSKSERENIALDKLRKQWPDFPEMTDAAQGYKDKIDDEALFVYAVDKILPVLMVNLGEKSVFWNHHKITLQMQVDEKVKIKASPAVAPYYDKLVAWMSNPDYYYKDELSS
jgi:5'-deoxynucleotidase YfbR-like HD superfamily hydrolase